MIEDLESGQGKNKKKKTDQPVDRNTLVPRLPDDLLYKILKRKLKENICRNRGYILDGYPRTFNDAKNVFFDIDENKAEDDPDRLVLVKDILPNSVILVSNTPDDFLKSRIKSIPDSQFPGSHYNEEGMTRRLLAYRTANDSIKGELSLFDFFNKRDIDILSVDGKSEESDIQSKSKIFLERVLSILI